MRSKPGEGGVRLGSTGAEWGASLGSGDLPLPRVAPPDPPRPARDDVAFGFPLLMLMSGGPLPLPPLPAPPGLPGPPPAPPVEPGTPVGEPPGTPGCTPSGEMETRETKLPAGMGRFSAPVGGAAGVAESAIRRFNPASPPFRLTPISG